MLIPHRLRHRLHPLDGCRVLLRVAVLPVRGGRAVSALERPVRTVLLPVRGLLRRRFCLDRVDPDGAAHALGEHLRHSGRVRLGFETGRACGPGAQSGQPARPVRLIPLQPAPPPLATLLQVIAVPLVFSSWSGLLLALAIGLPLMLVEFATRSRLLARFPDDFANYRKTVPALPPGSGSSRCARGFAFPVCNLQSVICSLQSPSPVLPSAFCLLTSDFAPPRSFCILQSAICNLQSPSGFPPFVPQSLNPFSMTYSSALPPRLASQLREARPHGRRLRPCALSPLPLPARLAPGPAEQRHPRCRHQGQRLDLRPDWKPALRAAGPRPDSYTSPHLLDVRERIRVSGEPMTRPESARLVSLVTPALKRVPVTWFEAVTAIAFLHFAECRLDYTVLRSRGSAGDSRCHQYGTSGNLSHHAHRL